MKENIIPKSNDAFQIEDIDGEKLLYCAGIEEVIYLNEAACLVWGLCDGERSKQDIIDLLSESYPDESSISSDVDDILNQFVEVGSMELAAQ